MSVRGSTSMTGKLPLPWIWCFESRIFWSRSTSLNRKKLAELIFSISGDFTFLLKFFCLLHSLSDGWFSNLKSGRFFYGFCCRDRIIVIFAYLSFSLCFQWAPNKTNIWSITNFYTSIDMFSFFRFTPSGNFTSNRRLSRNVFGIRKKRKKNGSTGRKAY